MPARPARDDTPQDLDSVSLERARHDPQAFTGVYERNHLDLAAFFYRRTACAHTTADLTAETFAAALAGAHRYDRSKGTGRGWLFGIAGNQYLKWLERGRVEDKARRRIGAFAPPLGPEDIERIESLVDLRPTAKALLQALALLTPSLRDAVLLRVAYDRPYEHVAAELGCSVATARVRVSRALAQLETALEGAS